MWTFRERVGLNIRKLRYKYQMSMKELADAIGTHDAQICRWENGQSGISLENAVRIADYFQISLDKLVE